VEHIGAIPICLKRFGSFLAMTQEGSPLVAHWVDFGRNSLAFHSFIEEVFHSASHFHFFESVVANFSPACCFPD
jgi:hypothetical protein